MDGSLSPKVNQKIGLAVSTDQLMIPLLEYGEKLPILISHRLAIRFYRDNYENALGALIRDIRQLTKLEWLKIKCPHGGEEMTQYITPQKEVDKVIIEGSDLKTLCSYCEHIFSWIQGHSDLVPRKLPHMNIPNECFVSTSNPFRSNYIPILRSPRACR